MKIIHLPEKLDIDAVLEEASRIKRWAVINQGHYEGLTIPELVFHDPSYFYWGLSIGFFNRQLLLEANLVEGRLRHIKLPNDVAVNSVFVVQLKGGKFHDFTIREKGVVKVKSRNDLRISSHLDFSLVSRPNFETDPAREAMLARVKQHFFEKDEQWLGPKDFQEFLGNPDNFSSGCHKKHISCIPRWDDASVLVETLSRETPQRVLSPAVNRKIEMALFARRLRERALDNE